MMLLIHTTKSQRKEGFKKKKIAYDKDFACQLQEAILEIATVACAAIDANQSKINLAT